MRTICVFIVALILIPSFQLQETMENENIAADQQEKVFHFQIAPGKYPSLFSETGKKTDIDTNNIKQSGWYADAIRNIRESEYEIKPADNTNEFVSPNRQQNLRAFYSADKFTLEPRADDRWKLQLTLKGVYSGKNKIYSTQQDAIAVTEKNKIQFNHNNEFTIEYINSTEGIRQNFIIQKEPDSKPQALNIKLQTNKGWFINKVHPKEIHFAKVNGNTFEKKLIYNDLKVWDANNRELAAHLETNQNEIEIVVNVKNAVYPITIDPISTGTGGTPDWIGSDANQADARYGINVSSAGDVNGDGYSEVIVGAYFYDDSGNNNEGRAFVYHGSATGLSATANSILQDANQAGAFFGESVNTAGDVNGDGYSDVIVGAYGYDDGGNTDEGVAFVYIGSVAGLVLTPIILDDVNQANAQLGFLNAVAGAGDLNGDGYSDVVVGARLFDESNTDEGRAWVYYGSASGLPATPDVILDDANQDGANFGASVASAGDVNGDGYSDVIVGASSYDDSPYTDEGVAFVYYGSASGLSTVPASILDDADQSFTLFGYSVNSAGDINADGYSDVIVGAYIYDDGGNPNEGMAFVYHGSSTGLSVAPNSFLDDADQAGAGLGIRVASAGDVNGDGYSDVIVGVYQYDGGNTDEGEAYIYFGSVSGLGASPGAILDDADQNGANLGSGATSAGDVNGDGYSDVIVGIWFYDDSGNVDEGRAFVYHGGPDGLSASPSNTPDDADQPNAEFGVSVACAGDVNADGYSDVIIGAWRYDDGGNPDEGIAFVYHGSASGLGTSYNYILNDCNQSGAFFGETVAGAGDVNGDGYSDVIIGADNYDDGGNNNEGRAFVYHGSPTGLSAVSNSILDDADQANAYFGVSVASAGDVNGDGYGDVIIGAIGYLDGTNSNEGRAFVYHGGATGLSATPNSTPDDADQANAWFGWSVAGAGDVNGDGFSDVIIGALTYDDGSVDEGKAFVYHGSAIGLSATPNSTPDDADQAFAQFGECVAGAGDVNGDGYSDVIIGAKLYDDGFADEGRAFVYYGSSTGLSAVPNSTPDDSNQASAHFGISVASAGDVNGDGYSDVIIGARYYDDGFADEGRAFVYYGSSTGLSAAPNSTPDDADQAGAYFGYSVASAGDINGDGYSDVIVGAYLYDDGGNNNEGGAFIYYGNNTGGLRNNLRLYNSDLVTPIQQSNMSDPNLFGAGLYTKSFIGKQKGKLVWETVKNGNPFSGSPINNSTAYTAQQAIFTDLGLSGVELKNQIAKQNSAKATYIRTRVKYDLVTAITGQVYGPWRYPEGFLRGRRDIGAVALPVKFISFVAVKQGQSSLLKWITVDEEPGVQFEVQHSKDGINFTTLISINGRNQPRNEYEWLHVNPANGNNFYRIRAVENQEEAYTATRKLSFSGSAGISIYPNPVVADQLLIIKNVPTTADQQVKISFINATGQLVWQKEILAINGSAAQKIPDIPGGAYLLLVQAGKWSDSKKIIVAGR